MDSIISPNQMAFIKGRQIFDASLIANECLDSASKSNTRYAFLKLDIEKAYDHVNWGFLAYLLNRMGFGEKWIQWIYWCISTATFSVIINNDPVGDFRSLRGLRQGDPLSPFLFVIVMEAFSRMMQFMIDGRCIEGFSLASSSGVVKLSHLLFADDTLCMIRDNSCNATALRRLLILFEACSGLKVNGNKSEIFIVGGNIDVSSMAERLGFMRGTLPSIYLGLPLGGQARNCALWNPVLESLERRLATWRSFGLSKGGRLTLIKSVLSATPTFMMSLFRLPVSVAFKIERLMRNFLWGKKNANGCHWVRWSKAKLPRDAGGLGIRDLRLFNKALLSKWCFYFSSDQGSLWNKLIRVKYGIDKTGRFTKKIVSPHGCSLWKGISACWEGFRKDLTFKIGDGKSVSFWRDRWVDSMSLAQRYPSLFAKARCKEASVFEMFDTRQFSFSPSIRFLSRLSSVEVVYKGELISMVYGLSVSQDSLDSFRWQDMDHFSVRLCYRSLTGIAYVDETWDDLWNPNVPSKVSFYGWCAMHGGVVTERKLQRKGFHLASRCCMCRGAEESDSHLLLHCSFVSKLWHLIWSISSLNWVMPSSVKEFWFMWRGFNGKERRNRAWGAIPLVLWWTVWIERNRRIFEGIVRPDRIVVDSFVTSVAEITSFARKGKTSITLEISNFLSAEHSC